ncbi:AzlD domain-containing protein [Jeongeupia wiesaeckerbachi]|uniref:AzlD domain-containing protein n=1 Tax=Jeongeupia wiesaeckerbachi TaxID=3051218 RepID=UPI003D8059C4
MNTVLLLAGMAGVTYVLRVGFWFGIGDGLPAWFKRALHYVPVAVLTAIVVPAVLLKNGAFDLDIHNARLVGALATGLIVWRFKHLLAGIGGGLLIFVLWRWLGPLLAAWI